ncbi:hypothetical protein ACI2JN_25085 [Ochrobactrum teleogrylli]|uniref:hypothetical protein n=1 Tax=Ochrobactrum teleogrylli TaxID=2479765 RepID=UPI00384EFCE2
MQADESGVVPNPLRGYIATRLEIERNLRQLTRKEFVSLLRQDAPQQRFSYGTYIRTVNGNNNITLRSLEHISQTLNISIGELLHGDHATPNWVKSLNTRDLRLLFAVQSEKARENLGLTKVAFAKFLGIAEVTYGKITDKRANFTVDTIAIVAFGVEKDPLEFLF